MPLLAVPVDNKRANNHICRHAPTKVVVKKKNNFWYEPKFFKTLNNHFYINNTFITFMLFTQNRAHQIISIIFLSTCPGDPSVLFILLSNLLHLSLRINRPMFLTKNFYLYFFFFFWKRHLDFGFKKTKSFWEKQCI